MMFKVTSEQLILAFQELGVALKRAHYFVVDSCYCVCVSIRRDRIDRLYKVAQSQMKHPTPRKLYDLRRRIERDYDRLFR